MKEVILGVCIVSFIMAAAENLTAGSRLGKQVRFILSLILLTVIFSPFCKGRELPVFEFAEFKEVSGDYSAEMYNNQIKKQVSGNVSAALGSELQKNGIAYEFIETEVNISETNSIFISKVTISTDNFERAEEIIRENLGEETEILNENG